MEKLRVKIYEEGFKQVVIAEHLRVSKQTVSDLLSGRNNNKKLLRRMSEYVGFNVNEYDRS